MHDRHVVVIGAGVAGLTAARELALAGLQVTVLEARERAGGRILTEHPAGSPLRVELGAEFVHGRHPDLMDLSRRAGLLLCEVSGEHRYGSKGRLRANDDIWSRTEAIMSRLPRRGPDRSFAEFLRSEFSGPEWSEAASWAITYVEGFNAADHQAVSTQWLAADQEAAGEIGDGQFWVVNGYGALITWLIEELRRLSVGILFGASVKMVDWRPGHVEVKTEGTTFAADAAVVTVPLSVLQAQPGTRGAIAFRPELSPYREALSGLAMGAVVRITFVFREAFWRHYLPTAKDGRGIPALSFLHAREERFPTWWSTHPLQTPLLTGWVGGPNAAEIARLPAEEQQMLALRSLATVTGLSVGALWQQLISTSHHDWQNDPYARGAYSYVPVGAFGSAEALAHDCARTLFLAGEATDTSGHRGTVHGAIASATRAARQILEKA